MGGPKRLYSAQELLEGRGGPGGEETREEAYRRGYCDGWVMALDAIHDAMFAGKMPRQRAYEHCWDYGMKGELRTWRRGDCSKVMWPPRCPWKAQQGQRAWLPRWITTALDKLRLFASTRKLPVVVVRERE